MINIYNESKVIKIENNRKISNESEHYMKKSSYNNNKVLIEAAKKMEIDIRDILDLYYIHSQYCNVKWNILNICIFHKEFWERF